MFTTSDSYARPCISPSNCVFRRPCNRFRRRWFIVSKKKIEDVEEDKGVQELGEYAVHEYNRQQHQEGSGSGVNGGEDLKFQQVVEAEKQVVSGIKYYLQIEAANSGGAPKEFDAEVVVQPWKKSKQLLNFRPSGVGK